jgi:hypothetical protein
MLRLPLVAHQGEEAEGSLAVPRGEQVAPLTYHSSLRL